MCIDRNFIWVGVFFCKLNILFLTSFVQIYMVLLCFPDLKTRGGSFGKGLFGYLSWFLTATSTYVIVYNPEKFICSLWKSSPAPHSKREVLARRRANYLYIDGNAQMGLKHDLERRLLQKMVFLHLQSPQRRGKMYFQLQICPFLVIQTCQGCHGFVGIFCALQSSITSCSDASASSVRSVRKHGIIPINTA